MHNWERPCLEHVQQSDTQAVQRQHMFQAWTSIGNSSTL